MSDYLRTLRSVGYLEGATRLGEPFSASCPKNAFLSAEDYVAKITSIFYPFIPQNIPDSQFNKIQRDLKKVVADIKKEKQL